MFDSLRLHLESKVADSESRASIGTADARDLRTQALKQLVKMTSTMSTMCLESQRMWQG